jgi:NADH-quinone oxidoreductase subunit J
VNAWRAGPALIAAAPPDTDIPNIVALGELLYSSYLFPFLLAGGILLVAMVGAIVLTHRSRGGVRGQNVSRQIRRRPQDAVKLTKPDVGEGVEL